MGKQDIATVLGELPYLVASIRVRALEIKRLTAAAINQLGLLDSYSFLKRKLVGSEAAIMVYHRISPKRDDWSLETLSPRSFERQMNYFCQNYEILSLDELVQCLRGGKSLPERAAVITLDDGYKDNYLYAYPVLRRHRIPATVFLVTGHIDTGRMFWWDRVAYVLHYSTVKRLELGELGSYSLGSDLDRSRVGLIVTDKLKNLPEERKNFLIEKLVSTSRVDIPDDLGKELILSWEEVREMSQNGIDLGAHSVTHPIMTRMPLKQARWEIRQSKEDIAEKVGKEATFFAYPHGEFGTEITKAVEECGYAAAVRTGDKWITPKTSPYQLSRISVSEDFDISKAMFCGLWGDLQIVFDRRRG